MSAASTPAAIDVMTNGTGCALKACASSASAAFERAPMRCTTQRPFAHVCSSIVGCEAEVRIARVTPGTSDARRFCASAPPPTDPPDECSVPHSDRGVNEPSRSLERSRA
eukprot:393451-Pleurochrysis_carterae.AAC.1